MTHNPIVPDVVALLQQMLSAVETLSAPTAPEGFSDYRSIVYSNITKGNGDGWYTLEGDRAITQPPVFSGRILQISFPTVERRGQDIRKFHLTMRANGSVFTFESGYDCFFSKTILATCAAASPEVLSQPVQLKTYIKELRTGDKTLAISLRGASNQLLSSEWQNDDDWNAIAITAIANVNTANGCAQ